MLGFIVLRAAFRRDAAILACLALVLGGLLALTIHQPGYTDAYYYFNAAQRWSEGDELTDAALWTYLAAPDRLPAPSHLYWMPLASILEAAALRIGGSVSPGLAFHLAQFPMVVCFAGLVVTAYGLGILIGQSRRTGWLAGLLTLFSGFYFAYWFTTDTFAVYGLVGALALLTIGLGHARQRIGYWIAGGILCGLAHLARADGLLLLAVLLIMAIWPCLLRIPGTSPSAKRAWRTGITFAVSGLIAYLVIMSPWFVRNLNVVGSILPVGGFQTAWMRSYDEIANYPPGASLSEFLSWGVGNILQSRWSALVTNAQTFIAVEGVILLTPFMLIALWRRRFDPLLSPFAVYALGLHAAMTLVFAFPGARGGLLHSASALVPFWMVLGALGLDDALAWLAKQRRWRLTQAKQVFGVALIGYAIVLSVSLAAGKIAGWNAEGAAYRLIGAALPPHSVVMVNDPPEFYYFTGLAAVVVPNDPPERHSGVGGALRRHASDS